MKGVSRRGFLKYMPLGFLGVAIPTAAVLLKPEPEEIVEFVNFQEVHWFDDKGKIVSVEKVRLEEDVRLPHLKVTKHIRERAIT
jgi:hypothetical protein